MRKRMIHVLNWEKWQARGDKELPWLKLWGRLFKSPWFQELDDPEKFCTIALLDLARQFNNRIDEESIFNGYLSRNYGLRMGEERVFKLCKYLADNDFLSDNASDVQDKTRQDKISNPENAPDSFKNEEPNPKSVDLKDIVIKGMSEPSKHKLYNELLVIFTSRGWRVDTEFLKPVFAEVARNMQSYEPRQMFPYFRAALKQWINYNAEMLSTMNKKQFEVMA